MITIAYLTCRDNPRFNWFIESFKNQYNKEVPVEVIMLDGSQAFTQYPDCEAEGGIFEMRFITPKPTPWQGINRLTKDNWFAASNARNSAIIYAKGNYIVFVDDLSVLIPGWWERVLKAYRENYIVLGAYKKVNDLVVEKGVIKQYKESVSGNDSRLPSGSHWATGSLLYGASFGAPIEHLLSVNGLDEICDGMGYEDTNLGMRLEKRGFRMFYDTQMMTFECEECHSEGTPFRREDPLLTTAQYYSVKEKMGITGVYQPGGRTDVSHLLMDMAFTNTRTDNAWTWGNPFILSELRETKKFPFINPETRHWATGIKLKDM